MAAISVAGQMASTSSAAGSLEVAILLAGDMAATSGAASSLDSRPQLEGSVAATSSAAGRLNSRPLAGSVASTSSAAGSLDSQPGLGLASIVEISGVSSSLSILVVDTPLVSSAGGVAAVAGVLTISLPSGWLGLTNTVTKAFSGFAAGNDLSIRFENDPRATPSSAWWLTIKVEHDGSSQRATAVKKFRHTGLVRVTVSDQLQKGAYHLYEIADLISEMFSGKELADNISLGPAQLQRVGRDGTKSVLDVVLPFQHDF